MTWKLDPKVTLDDLLWAPTEAGFAHVVIKTNRGTVKVPAKVKTTYKPDSVHIDICEPVVFESEVKLTIWGVWLMVSSGKMFDLMGFKPVYHLDVGCTFTIQPSGGGAYVA